MSLAPARPSDRPADRPADQPAPGLRGFVPLDDWALLVAHGPDAPAFLQGQLTNDVLSLRPGEGRLAGYCSVKGRLLASFWVWRTDDASPSAVPRFELACSRGLAAAIAKRLAMYVLRAKVKIEDTNDTVSLIGLLHPPGQGIDDAQRRALPPATWAPGLDRLLPELGSASGVPLNRSILVLPAAERPGRLEGLAAGGWAPLPAGLWERLEVLSGIPRIGPLSQDLFVPQMINFERVGGVSFRKGCYPGQEVVARSQYLGKLKRRMFLGAGLGAMPAVGADVVGSGAEPVGRVVLSAADAGTDRFVALFECRSDALPEPPATEGAQPAATDLRIGDATLSLLPLPYAIVDTTTSDAA